jgi:integrase
VAVFNTEVVYPPRDSLHDLLKDSLFLTPSEISQLVTSPAMDTLKGARDRAMIATLICTGVWARELVNLDVEDVLEAALQIRQGDKINRIIPYSRLKWGLSLLKTWMRRAGIYSGPVFVSIGRNDQINFDETGNPKRLSSTPVSLLLRSYPIRIDDQYIPIKARQLRYMYDHILYSQGTPDLIILRNMGYGENEGIQILMRSYLLPKQAVLRRMALRNRDSCLDATISWPGRDAKLMFLCAR